jgi:hypothetical protein
MVDAFAFATPHGGASMQSEILGPKVDVSADFDRQRQLDSHPRLGNVHGVAAGVFFFALLVLPDDVNASSVRNAFMTPEVASGHSRSYRNWRGE